MIAIGNPFFLEFAVSSRIVSGIRTNDELANKFPQIITPISSWSSGRQLFNMLRNVIDITTLPNKRVLSSDLVSVVFANPVFDFFANAGGHLAAIICVALRH